MTTRYRSSRPSHGGDGLRQAGQARERLDAAARVLVEPRVLDRPGDERRRVGEEREDALVELARRDRVEHDGAERRSRARGDRDRDHRLEALLLDLGEVLHARVGHRALADELWRPVARDPAGEALVEPHLDPADEVRVDPRRGAQPQSLAVAQVDEAGVAVRRVAEQVDDALEHAVEVGAGRHRADDRVQRLGPERRDGPVRRRRRVAGGRDHRVGACIGGHRLRSWPPFCHRRPPAAGVAQGAPRQG